MILREYLAVPHVLVAESVLEGGRWLRRLSYPELPGCTAESSLSVLDAQQELERRRVLTIVRLIVEGDRPAIPRAPVNAAGMEVVLQELDLEHLGDLLDGDEEQVRKWAADR